MTFSIAHLGPPGTYTEAAAIAYADLRQHQGEGAGLLCPYPTIAQTLQAVANEQVQVGIVPVENSIQGSVTVTLDTLWTLDNVQILQALVLPIHHMFISLATELGQIKTVYSHPQALAQCQHWLNRHLPAVQQVACNATTEALEHLTTEPTAAAIASERAAQLYNLPVVASQINDYPDNCTRFWVIGRLPCAHGQHISLAFSAPANVPGALVKPLEVFARRGINLSRIESRPTKRSLGEYLFFLDLEADGGDPAVQAALTEFKAHTEVLKIFGTYDITRFDHLPARS